MDHVVWPHLMTLAVWQEISARLLQSGYSLESFQEDSSAFALLRQLASELESKLLVLDRKHRSDEEAESEGAALDAYFSRVQQALPSFGPALASTSETARRLLNLVEDAVASRPCTTCTGMAVENACKWTSASEASDYAWLRSQGHCIRGVRDLFSAAHSVARATYRASGVSPQQVVELSTGQDPRCGAFGTALDATTLEAGTAGCRAVNISFNIKKLSHADYLSLFYLFSHECIAHAFCGEDVGAFEAVKSLSFHEGWMDCVVESALVRELTQQPSSASPMHVLYGADFLSVMRRVRCIRFDTGHPDAPRDAVKWVRGSEAYHSLLFLLEETCRQKGLPPQDVIEKLNNFSLQLNASTEPHSKRSEMVNNINRAFSRSNPEAKWQAILLNLQIFDFAEHFLATGDWQLFFNQLVTTRWR